VVGVKTPQDSVSQAVSRLRSSRRRRLVRVTPGRTQSGQ
jgi:hypothetical protein